MIKNVKWIFVVLIISSLISFSFVGKNTPTEGLTIGDKAPTFTICGEKQLIDLKDLRGKYVLLSFWASRAYLRHLFHAQELLAMQIASIHNLAFYLWLAGEARKHIIAGDFSTWKPMMVKRLSTRL
jgi:hypothetical protein